MKRLLLLIFLSVAGCAGFDDYAYYDGAGYENSAPSSCGCQSQPVVSAATGLVPTVSQMPALQTREPDVASKR